MDLSRMYAGTDEEVVKQLLGDSATVLGRARRFNANWNPAVVGSTSGATTPGRSLKFWRAYRLAFVRVVKRALDEYNQMLGLVNQPFGEPAFTKPTYYLDVAQAAGLASAELAELYPRLTKESAEAYGLLEFLPQVLGVMPRAIQWWLLRSKKLTEYRHLLRMWFEAGRHQYRGTASDSASDAEARSTLEQAANQLLRQGAQITDGRTTWVEPYSGLTALAASGRPTAADQAAQALSAAMHRAAPATAALLQHVIAGNVRAAAARGYASAEARQYAAAGFAPTTIPAMLAMVEASFSIARDYYELRAQVAGSEGPVNYWRRREPACGSPRTYSLAEVVELGSVTLAALGSDFADCFRWDMCHGGFDLPKRPSKAGMTACWGPIHGLPSYVLTTFTGVVFNLEQLVHEALHAVHLRKVREHNNATTHRMSPLVLESRAIITHPFLFTQLLAATTDREEQLRLMIAELDSIIEDIFRQTAATAVERELYELVAQGITLTEEGITEVHAHHMAAYLGDSILLDSGAKRSWAGWFQLLQEFYNPGYALGRLVALLLYPQFATDPTMMEKFERVLAAGNSLRPEESFAILGLDVTDQGIWAIALAEVSRKIEAVANLARDLGKI